jgi:hypothetical protein
MTRPRCSEVEFKRLWVQYRGQPKAMSEGTGFNLRSIFSRRANLAKKGVILPTAPQTFRCGDNGHGVNYGWQVGERPYRARATASIRNGIMLVFSDAHYWPGEPSVAHEALLKIPAQSLRSSRTGMFDGASYAPRSWAAKLPTVES